MGGALTRMLGRAPAGWTTVKTASLDSDASGYEGYTLRELIPASVLTDISGTQMRLTLRAAFSTQTGITKFYIGLKGTGSVDFAGTPTQVLFGGSASITVAPSGGAILSDAFTFAYDGTSDVVIASYSAAALGSAGYRCLVAPQTTSGFYKLGDSAATTGAVTAGYTTAATADVIEKIEVS